MKLSILVPVFNEENTISLVIDKLISIKLPCKTEVIIVDDGSTDRTKKILTDYKTKVKTEIFKIIFHKKNSGKGEAVKTAVRHACGDYILIQDADLEYDPSEIINLLKPLKKNKEKRVNNLAVYGTRLKNKNNIMPKTYFWGNKLLTLLTNVLFGIKLTDMETGYKLLPSSILKKEKLKSKHFDFEPEITAKLIKNKVKIIEVPITYRGRDHLAGKKLTLLDAFEAIQALFYFRFFN